MAAVLVAALFSLAPAARGDDPPCAKWCAEGWKHYEAHEYEEARDCYAKAREVNPRCGNAQGMYGASLASLALTTNEQKATWDQAIAEWEKTLTLECPGSEKVYSCLNLGSTYANIKHDQAKAIKWYKTGVTLDPTYGTLWLAMAEWYYRNGALLEEALDCSQKALDTGTLDEKQTATAKDYIASFKEALADPARKKSSFQAVFELPSLGGLAASSDMATFVVSVPTTAQLIYYDASEGKEAKKVSLEFQPGRLAVQGKVLYATARGAAKLYALELDSGKVSKTIKLPSPVLELCCNRSRGLLYGTTAAGEVLSIDPASGKVTTCQAKGALVAIDPSKPGTVYTLASTDPKKPDGKAVLRKYTVSGADLKLVDTNDDAAVGARGLDVSPDGKRVAVVGEGGWNAKAEGLKASVIAVFEAEKITSTAAEFDAQGSPRCIAFHPFLDVGVAITKKGIVQLNSRSFVHVHDWPQPAFEAKEPRLVAFVDGGKKIACWEPGDASKNVDGRLGLLSLVLTDDEQAALQKALAKSH